MRTISQVRVAQRAFRVAATIVALVLGASDVYASNNLSLGTALDFAGFELFGTRNPLSGGTDFLAVTDWQNRRFDAGPEQFVFNGPVSFEVNTGGRPIPRLDLSFQTALDSQAAATPLNYTYSATFGGKNTNVNGSLLVDTHLGIDAMGFYDVQLRYSSRQTRTLDGQASSTQTRDADLGPISVSGNIVIDALTALTDPIFASTGRTNPLDNFSGLSKLHEILTAPLADANALLANAESVAQNTGGGSGLNDLLGNLFQSASRSSTADTLGLTSPSGVLSIAVVPEPPCLLMLMVAAPLVISRGFHSLGTRRKRAEWSRNKGASADIGS